MKSIKQYALEHGISVQAVHQQMKRERNKERLEGHVEIIEGMKFLDEIAEQILNESRQNTPNIAEDLRKDLRIKELEDQLKQKEQYITGLEAGNIARMQELTEAKEQLLAIEGQTQSKIDAAVKAAEDHLQIQHNQEVSKLKMQLYTEYNRKLTLKERLTGRKENKPSLEQPVMDACNAAVITDKEE